MSDVLTPLLRDLQNLSDDADNALGNIRSLATAACQDVCDDGQCVAMKEHDQAADLILRLVGREFLRLTGGVK